MRILALDYGQDNVGVAISDPTNRMARPLAILKNNKNLNSHLKKLIEQNGVGEIVIGLNISLSGELGEENRKKMDIFSDRISKLGLPMKFWDERLSTKTAKMVVRERSSRGLKDGRVDDIAAALILQNYLDRN